MGTYVPDRAAAMRWLERYLTERSPKLKHFAELAGDLARWLRDD